MNNLQNGILRVLIFLIFFSVAIRGALTILGKKLPENLDHYVNIGTLVCLIIVLILILIRALPSMLKNKKKKK